MVAQNTGMGKTQKVVVCGAKERENIKNLIKKIDYFFLFNKKT